MVTLERTLLVMRAEAQTIVQAFLFTQYMPSIKTAPKNLLGLREMRIRRDHSKPGHLGNGC